MTNKFWFSTSVSCSVFSAISLAIVPALASGLELKSGSDRIALIELYTSEGCSSCPPADRWLSDLRGTEKLWKDYVPVAFHVDYWDSLGWKDPFAQARYTQRQRALAAERAMHTIYTPGFFRDSREWRPTGGLPMRDGQKASGVLMVSEKKSGNFAVRFEPRAGVQLKRPKVFGVVLGNGLKSKVTAGENRGETLTHDFVVLNDQNVELKKQGDAYIAELQVDVGTHSGAHSWSVAFWVSEAESLFPLQAVGGEWIREKQIEKKTAKEFKK